MISAYPLLHRYMRYISAILVGPLRVTAELIEILQYYGAQRVCILPGSLNFNFLILCSCAVPPEFYGISLHSTLVYTYDFTKEYKK